MSDYGILEVAMRRFIFKDTRNEVVYLTLKRMMGDVRGIWHNRRDLNPICLTRILV